MLHQRALPLDNLRAVLILVVVLDHAARAFSPESGIDHFLPLHSSWFLDLDPDAPLFSWLTDLQRAFAIPLLFFISGLLFEPSLQRRGVGSYLRSRSLRLGIPLAGIVFLLAPLCLYLPYLQTWIHFSPGDFFRHSFDTVTINPAHGWFLWMLLLFNVLTVFWRSSSSSSYHRLRSCAVRFCRLPFGFPLLLIAASVVSHCAGNCTATGRAVPLWNFVSGPFAFDTSLLPRDLTFFLLGVLLGQPEARSKSNFFWPAVRHHPWPWCLLSLLLALLASGWIEGVGSTLVTGLLCATLTLTCLSLGFRFLDRDLTGWPLFPEHSLAVYILHLPLLIWTEYILAFYVSSRAALLILADLAAVWTSAGTAGAYRWAAALLGSHSKTLKNPRWTALQKKVQTLITRDA
ncbi:MAG: acyltransferase family protein [Desulfohalobiaceae bacterium]